MNLRHSLLLATACSSLLFASAQAHHSFAAMYDAAKPVRLVGTLTKVEWTNPHSYFHLNVTAKDGSVSTWACEGAGPGALSRRGFNKSDIKIGDQLIVDGYLAKAGGKIIDARRVTLPNGKIVSGGTPGDGGPGDAAGAGRPPGQ
ncbi:DUF6152 family protein [Steroidobacter sp.]|uniref:DUF6152 family protein n=1 Tax=Steroidobacter sp. TaxID=1978227 RepID=UPI001A3F858D|nr:DUF6152 family protein [Steroidobacter sp.]MBL8266112.1 hypothetical protein [Steroidobacter sp.]